MTDREKLAELLHSICENHAPCSMEVVANQLIANGVTFATDTNDGCKWISVEKEKPDDFVSVLGHITGAGDFPAVRECYRGGNVFFFPALLDIYPIDKWTYIPEPGKEDV